MKNKTLIIVVIIILIVILVLIGITWYFYEKSQTISSLSLENEKLNNRLNRCLSDETKLNNRLDQCYLNLSEYVPNLRYMDLENCNQCYYIYDINNKTDKRKVCTQKLCMFDGKSVYDKG